MLLIPLTVHTPAHTDANTDTDTVADRDRDRDRDREKESQTQTQTQTQIQTHLLKLTDRPGLCVKLFLAFYARAAAACGLS